MPCDDCPGEELAMPRPARGARNYIVYTGEDYAAFYRLAASAIPEGELRHGRPVALSDGSLEYPTEPDDIHGYERDAENPRRLRPAWPECPVAYVERRSLLRAVGHPRHLYARQDGLRRQADHDGPVPAVSRAADY